MGTKNYDRISIKTWREAAPTVEAMLKRGWEAYAKCGRCRRSTPVDLALVVRRSGPEATLWNRTQPCHADGCRGLVEFYGVIPGYRQEIRLDDSGIVDPRSRPGRELLVQALKHPEDRLLIHCVWCDRPDYRLRPTDAFARFGIAASLDGARDKLMRRCNTPGCCLMVLLRTAA